MSLTPALGSTWLKRPALLVSPCWGFRGSIAGPTLGVSRQPRRLPTVRCSVPSMQHACTSCGALKLRGEFSRTQFSKGAERRRCKECVINSNNAGPVADATAPAISAASAVHVSNRKKRQQNSTSKNPEGSVKAVRVRVKDVQKHYGVYLPLKAYQKAGVADSWNDYVTEEEVEAASDVHDVYGIAHDIDTQWGAIPEGGAYSDSNHFYGPGRYEYC